MIFSSKAEKTFLRNFLSNRFPIKELSFCHKLLLFLLLYLCIQMLQRYDISNYGSCLIKYSKCLACPRFTHAGFWFFLHLVHDAAFLDPLLRLSPIPGFLFDFHSLYLSPGFVSGLRIGKT